MVQAEQLCHSSDITAPNAGVLASESRVIPFRRPARLRKIDWEYEPAAELIDTLERAPRSYGAPSLRMLVDTSFAQHRETGRPVDINIAGIPNIGKSTLVSQILARWNYMQRSASFPNDPSEIMAYISWDDILRTAGKELGIILPGQQDGDYTEKQLEQLTLVEEQADVLAKKKGFSVIK
ncbi:MAG TPA: hypothetical protein VLF68_02365, partial [Candidatus Saccharimonadales bacterium]|nr:hypothetical protein [Candidatus Saccharimonadales bacterium]